MIALTQNYLTRGFWGDEAWTSLISQLPYMQMLKTTAADFHPPAYYSVVALVYKFLAPTEIITRSISIVFYLLTLFLVYKLASEIKGKVFGALTTLVVALNPIFFTYAFEARNYTMFAFAAVGSIYFLTKLSTGFTKIRAVGFVLFTVLGIYTHYYMFFTLAAQGLYLLLFDRKIFWRFFGLYIIVGILYLPWLPFLAGQLKSVGQSYWIGGIDKRTYYEAFLRILGGEDKSIYRSILFGLSLLLLTIGIVQHLLRPSTGWKLKPHFEKPYILIWFWAIIPFIFASLPGLRLDGLNLPFRPIFFWRYLINASVPLAMVMVHSSQKFPRFLFTASVAMMVILSIAINTTTFGKNPQTFRQAYQQKVLPSINGNDKIVTVLPSFAEVMYYRNRMNLPNELIVLPEGLVQFSGKSLLDIYVENGKVKIDNAPDGPYFELRPGPSIIVHSQ